jgi:hypothetical protein
MATKKENEREALLAELDLLKIEFSTLRQEILQLIEAERQYLNLSLVAIGGGLGLFAFIAQQKIFVVLLLFPFIFHVLLWEMLKSMRSVSHISNYLVNHLIPRANFILNALGRADQSVQTLGWETHISSRRLLSRGEIITSALTPTRHWIPVLAVGGLVIAYLLVIQGYGYSPTMGELSLVIVNLVLLIWAAIQNIIVARSVMHEKYQE